MNKTAWKENIQIFGSVILIGVLLLYIVLQLFVPEMTIRVFGFKPYVVITESMEPVIKVNDMVFVRNFDIDEAEVGDIITFDADIDYNGTKEIVTHYIYSIDDSGPETFIRTNRYFPDDVSPTPDIWQLVEDDVHGAYWFKIPQLGLVSEFLKSPFGIAAVVVNIGVIGGIVYLIKYSKKEQEIENDSNQDGKTELKD